MDAPVGGGTQSKARELDIRQPFRRHLLQRYATKFGSSLGAFQASSVRFSISLGNSSALT
jgi:hypothetical protein